MEERPLRDLFAADHTRGETFTAEAVGLFLDYTRFRKSTEKPIESGRVLFRSRTPYASHNLADIQSRGSKAHAPPTIRPPPVDTGRVTLERATAHTATRTTRQDASSSANNSMANWLPRTAAFWNHDSADSKSPAVSVKPAPPVTTQSLLSRACSVALPSTVIVARSITTP